MNPHACLLAVLISGGLARSPGFPVQPPVQALRHAPPDVTPAAHDRPSPLTRMHARRGGKGRRRGREDVSGSPRQAGSAANAVRETPSTAAALAALAVQHASHEDLLAVAYSHRAALRPGLLSQALLRLAKPLVQVSRQTAREAVLADPRLHALFLAASSPATADDGETAAEPPAGGGTNQSLSGPQAADVLWACGLLQWLPADDDDGVAASGGHHRLARLVALVARAASSEAGIDDGHVTNVLWALERLGVSKPPAEKKKKKEACKAEVAREAETPIAAPARGAKAAVETERKGGSNGRGAWEGDEAVEELRSRVENLPFRAIPSLFEGLRVEDFRDEVAFRRDEILLGGGKVLSESRLTAWQSSDGLPFAYSGKVMEPAPFSPNVLRLRDALYERTGVLYDGVLLNLYESRSSAMRYHSDPDVGTIWTQDTSVVSVGDTRQFALRRTLDHSPRGRHAFYLSSGDCVRMTDGCQRDYQHCVKVAKEEVGARVSLVFKQSISGLERRRGRAAEGVAVGGGGGGGGSGAAADIAEKP
ncbi:unnamed protein product [Ectocarpus sp. 13 AM-2016]